jgi:hypothetical protein
MITMESSLTEKLKRIFKLDKVSFDLPGESQEQEGIFIAVERDHAKVVDKREIHRVQGKLSIFASSNKLPFGYLAKAIAAARAEDVRPLFFFNFEENKGTIGKICERSLEFIFLFDSQYDPNLGTITSVNLSMTET